MCNTYTLIQDQETDLGETEFSSGNKVIQSSRCPHHYINLITGSHTKKSEKNHIETNILSPHLDFSSSRIY